MKHKFSYILPLFNKKEPSKLSGKQLGGSKNVKNILNPKTVYD